MEKESQRCQLQSTKGFCWDDWAKIRKRSTHEAEQRSLASPSATDEPWKDQSGKKQQRTEWHNVVVWRKLADICGQCLTKGK